jgi:hypothetical protein
MKITDLPDVIWVLDPQENFICCRKNDNSQYYDHKGIGWDPSYCRVYLMQGGTLREIQVELKEGFYVKGDSILTAIAGRYTVTNRFGVTATMLDQSNARSFLQTGVMYYSKKYMTRAWYCWLANVDEMNG